MAVQICKALGAYVVTTASGSKAGFLEQLGADEIVDYRQLDFTEIFTDVDVVLDPIGGTCGSRSIQTIRRGGTIVSLAVGNIYPRLDALARAAKVRSATMLVEANGEALRQVVNLWEQGKMHVEVEQVFPMDCVAEAHILAEGGGRKGKLVLAL